MPLNIGEYMATLGASKLTLLDLAKRQGEGGKIDVIAEILTQQNEILEDMPWIECNDGTGHRTTVRSGLPSATWRMLNYGVQPNKSVTTQIKDACGMLEAYSEIDKALADLNGNTAAFRMSEDKAFIEGINQSLSQTLFYGDTTVSPEKFGGLAPRYNTMVSANAASSFNVLNGGGAGSTNTSIWLVVWGPNTVHGIYPKGSKVGLSHEDLGQQTLLDVNGGRYEGYRTHYKFDAGFTVRDWRYVVRICNVDVALLTKNAATGADLLDLMVQAIEKIDNLNMGTPVFYVNRTVRSFLRRQIVNKSNVHLLLEQIAGKHVLSFDGIPVKRCDQILSTEATVV
jgi:hypothetical protein